MRILGLIVLTGILLSSPIHSQTKPDGTPNGTSQDPTSFESTSRSVPDPTPGRITETERETTSPRIVGCGNVTSLPLYPFIKIAEFTPKKNLSEDFWINADKLTAHKRSIIRVCIDAEKLVKHPRFSRGTISIAAKLGQRAIEVEGYSAVGKPQKRRSPMFRQDLNALRDVIRDLDSPQAPGRSISTSGTAERGQNALALLENLTSTPETKYTFLRLTNLSSVLLDRQINSLREALRQFDEANKLIADEESKINQRITDAEEKLRALEADRTRGNRNLQAVQEEIRNLRIEETEETERRAELEGIERGFKRYIQEIEDEIVRNEKAAVAAREAAEDVDKLQAPLVRRVEAIRRALGSIASSIPQTLDESLIDLIQDAEIFLREQDAKAGDVLRIFLIHYPEVIGPENDQAQAEAVDERTLAEIEIDDYGFHTSVVDSFLLVKRLDEPKAASAGAGDTDSEPSPSNFKGAAGASLLWSYTPRPHEPWYRFVLGPSWGINVSYVDFDSKKEIEIGAALVAGFFRDQVHVGCGVNLNVSQGREYCFVGFSFAKIKENLTGK